MWGAMKGARARDRFTLRRGAELRGRRSDARVERRRRELEFVLRQAYVVSGKAALRGLDGGIEARGFGVAAARRDEPQDTASTHSSSWWGFVCEYRIARAR